MERPLNPRRDEAQLEAFDGEAVPAVRQETRVARALDRLGEASLILGGDAGDATGNDLSTLGGEAREHPGVAPIDRQRLVGEEGVDLALGAATSATPVAIFTVTIAITAITIAVTISSTTAAAFAASINVTHLCLTS